MNRRTLLQLGAALSVVPMAHEALAQSAGPTVPHSDALLFQDDPQFWYETVRLFGAAE